MSNDKTCYALISTDNLAAVERMLSHEQETRLNAIVQFEGRAHVELLTDGTIEVTVPGGRCCHITEEGRMTTIAANHNIDWEA